VKTLAGSLSAEDREIVVESNRSGRRILCATLHGCLTYDQRGNEGCQEPAQAVGTVTGWTYENFQMGGWSFTWSIPWESAVRVWWRDEAPEADEVRQLLKVEAASRQERDPQPLDPKEDT
jgi:hypothetical protein